MEYLRFLDIDDLIIMKMLLVAPRLTDISKALGLTPPALSHRLRKCRTHLPGFELKVAKGSHKRELSETARLLCLKATKALSILTGETVNG
jgi:hypothetical protein